MKLFSQIKAFVKDEEGASALEYALMAFMVAVLVATFTTPVQTALTGVFTKIVNALKT